MKNDTTLICNISVFFQKNIHIDIQNMRRRDIDFVLITIRSFIV